MQKNQQVVQELNLPVQEKLKGHSIALPAEILFYDNIEILRSTSLIK